MMNGMGSIGEAGDRGAASDIGSVPLPEAAAWAGPSPPVTRRRAGRGFWTSHRVVAWFALLGPWFSRGA